MKCLAGNSRVAEAGGWTSDGWALSEQAGGRASR